MIHRPLDAEFRRRLERVLSTGQRLSAVGPASFDEQVEHASAFTRGFPSDADGPIRALDLGTGGGLPGLVLASLLPTSHWVLLDAARRRIDLVTEALADLELADRAVAVHGRAEEFAGARPGAFDVVTARSFGPPAVTAECARPLLRIGGRLIVSDPPAVDHDARWPRTGLAALGYEVGDVLSEPNMTVLVASHEPAVPLPRRAGVAARRPRW